MKLIGTFSTKNFKEDLFSDFLAKYSKFWSAIDWNTILSHVCCREIRSKKFFLEYLSIISRKKCNKQTKKWRACFFFLYCDCVTMCVRKNFEVVKNTAKLVQICTARSFKLIDTSEKQRFFFITRRIIYDFGEISDKEDELEEIFFNNQLSWLLNLEWEKSPLKYQPNLRLWYKKKSFHASISYQELHNLFFLGRGEGI